MQEIAFRPTFNKWEGKICHGFMIHVLDHPTYRPYRTALSLLASIIDMHGEQFAWKEPPYEYEYEKLPIDMILGDSSLRRGIAKGEEVTQMEETWKKDLDDFMAWRNPFLLYT